MPEQTKPMTPTEALEFLDICAANISMGRPAHIKGLQAVQILQQLIPVEDNGNKKEKLHPASDQEAGSPKEESEGEEGAEDSSQEAGSGS